MRKKLALLVAAVLMPVAAWAADDSASDGGVEITGYYKNLLLHSKTLPAFGPGESYLLDLNRLRLEFKGRLSERVDFDFQYDNEILLGNYLETAQFRTLDSRPPDTHFDLEGNYHRGDKLLGRHRLYRGYMRLVLPEADLRIGRQRIAWGTAQFWNPVDLLNPFNPIQVEREERIGVDAAVLDWNTGPLSRLSLVHAKHRGGTSSAARWRTNQAGFDLSVLAGRFRDGTVTGIDFAGQAGEIGLRGEMTHTDSPRARFNRAVVGADYTFRNSLSLNAELYYNGEGAANASAYDFNRLLIGEIQNVARRYLGLYAGYDVSPLLRWDNHLVVNRDDHSYFFSPRAIYSLSDNWELVAGVQFFRGESGSEYGAFNDLYFFQVQRFF